MKPANKPKLIESIFKKSSHPAFIWVVFFMTMLESIFLFIPPEVFMAPPIIANKKRTVPIVIAASAGSLLGGAIAYLIGYLLFDSIGIWLIETFASMDKFEIAKQMFSKHGLIIIFIAAFTPIPYKLMALCAGFLGFPAILFLGVAGIFRMGRFAAVGYLLWKFQEQANAIVKKYFWYLTIGAIFFAVFGIWLITLI